ncbi:unnamed protein product [Owenia fusiformis]|uniref:isoleucine--tRNA ligase n=1 Tax=Owenia fusiformis TaxID=6347 RepID=A0A8J1TCY1_OWEFU|nr:unnamed protein product [Owenia fusiformis]
MRIMKHLLRSYRFNLIISGRRWMSKKYTDTLNLPKTTFPSSMKGNQVPLREEAIQESAEFQSLYGWQREHNTGPEFILHDGPPYANGAPHVGHALNKILKDIINRYKVMRWYKVHYQPGWDCHGLPIELKALQTEKESFKQMDPVQIRIKAHKFAERAIRKQKESFKRWGVMADWDNCYHTFDKQYEAKQIETFFKLYEKGYVYKDYMPVYWSPSSRTALAEAELEYNTEHVSKAIYVKFSINHLPEELCSYTRSDDKIWAIIWTTTPWTLPSNQAVCYGPNVQYCLARCSNTQEVFLIATEGLQVIAALQKTEFETLCTFQGDILSSTKYRHPTLSLTDLPFLPGHHVTAGKGTGLAHVAGAHGHDDFKVINQHKIKAVCIVNEEGEFTEEAGDDLAGKSVLGEGNQTVIDMLRDRIVHHEEFVHSYPYDWRTKKPVIILASKQWFINTERIKTEALESLKHVTVRPMSLEHSLTTLLQARPYWCISRQRVWGVPIPVFYNTQTGQPLITQHTIEHIRDLVEQHGTSCWWTLPIEELLPASVLIKSGLDPDVDYSKGEDILDIWFDSGVSWAAVLGGKQADLYLEGVDQFRGWFQSSLLTSIAVNGTSPYKSLLVHGFVMDESGKKMSKSLGNVIDPQQVINGGKNLDKEAAYGVDILRWWAASCHNDTQVLIGRAILDRTKETIFKIRKSLRYLLGNLSEFSTEDILPYEDLLPQDQYMLHLLNDYCSQVTRSYDEMQFGKVLHSTEKFINTHVSGFYSNIVKDRLYCSEKYGSARLSSQTTQFYILSAISKVISPIMPHLGEEVQTHHPCFQQGDPSIFKTGWLHTDKSWHNKEVADVFHIVLGIRDSYHEIIGQEQPVLFDVVVCAQGDIFKKLQTLQQEQTSCSSPLNEVLQCSWTSLLENPPAVLPDESQTLHGTTNVSMQDGSTSVGHFTLVVMPAESFRCERCRRYLAEKSNEPCQNCLEVMAGDWAVT